MWQLKTRFCGWSMLWLVLSAPVLAVPTDSVLRARFLKAEKTINKVDNQQAEKLLSDLHDYPLKPYIELEYLSRSLGNTPLVQQFIDKHKGTPLEWSMKKRWLMYLASAQLTQPFLKNYEYGSDTLLDCYALEMRLINEPAAKVWPDVTALWVVGESQPKECDALFKRWQKAGQRNTDVVLTRLRNAADGGDERIIPYIRTLLPSNLQYLGDKWKQVIANPSLVSKQKFLPLKHKAERELVRYAVEKLVWKKPDQALAIYQRFASDPALTKAQRIRMARQLAIALASKNDIRAEKFLKMVPLADKDDLFLQWQVAWHLRRSDWVQVQNILHELPKEQQDKEQRQYWLARAMLATGQTDHGNQIMKKLATERSYYGYMAAARLGLTPALGHKPVPVTAAQYQSFKRSGSILRMREWEAIGRPNAAKRELNFLQKYGSEQQKLSAAKLAFDSGWYDRAIAALADAEYWDDVEMRFPMVFNKEIQKHAKAANVDPAWAMAITRRESTFLATAQSPVGAQGLMQIMPQTAKHLAGRTVRPEQLMNPNFNIDMGTEYLNYLMKANDNNLVFATASYNAGYSRVKSWMPKGQQLELDVWIENIPFKETRDYVKAVLTYYQIYNIRMKQQRDVFKPLTTLKVGELS